MNNIQGINSCGGPNGIVPSNPPGAKPEPPPSASKSETDQVEISSVARYLQKIAMLPEIRAEKVEEVRQALSAGVYDVESKLPEALDKFLEEYFP